MASVPQARVDAQCPRCPRVLATRQGLRRHLRAVHDVIDPTRTCTRCGQDRDAEAWFGVVGRDSRGRPRYRSVCNECKNADGAARRARSLARPESHKRRDRKHHVARYFGLTLAEYDAAVERFREEQGGVCAICGAPEPSQLDHCHKTGRLRGLLCRPCNQGAGLLQDDPALADALAAYLRKAGQ